MDAYEFTSTDPITVASLSERDTVAELEDYDVGDVVKWGDGDKQVGAVLEEKTSDFMWPDSDGERVKASEQKPVYIVARASGGSAPFTADELESISNKEAFGESTKSTEKRVKQLKDGAEMAPIYARVRNPSDVDQFNSEVDELVAAPGVDDPEVGFTSWPDSWQDADRPARMIALDAWSSMGGTFTTCVNELGSKRLCAAFKDEIYGTEAWRGGFGVQSD